MWDVSLRKRITSFRDWSACPEPCIPTVLLQGLRFCSRDSKLQALLYGALASPNLDRIFLLPSVEVQRLNLFELPS